MVWNYIKSEKDFPTMGQLAIVCRDLGDEKTYYITEWNLEDEKYWKQNNIIAWAEFDEIE